MTQTHAHRPVLLDEAVAALAVKPSGLYVDGTFGRGGHSGAILDRLAEGGRLLAFDKDPDAVAAARARYGQDKRFSIVRGSFAMLRQVVETQDLSGKVNGLLLDLGVSSPQLDDPRRGFSFQHEGPLEMRMDPDSGVSAGEWLQQVSEEELSRILRDYGEERFHRRIARAIVEARREAPLHSTTRLADVVAAAVPRREKHKHPATRTFQAIRIHLNRELEDLRTVLDAVPDVLAIGGRLVVISFHSLEDRVVKRFIRAQQKGELDELPPGLPVASEPFRTRLRAIGKPVRAGEAEVRDNPRARSAIMRIAERVS